MSRAGKKDVLAAGGAKMVIAGGVGESDIFRNVAPEGSRTEDQIVVDKPVAKRYRFVPRDEQMLIRPKPAEVVTTVIITEGMEQEKPAEGTVLAVGPKVDIPVGAHAVYGKYAGTEYKLNGETLLIMRLEDIMGTVEEITGDDYVVSAGRA